jgi:transposase
MKFLFIKVGVSEMDVRTLGIDLAKDIFQLHGVDARGKIVISKKVRRNKLFQEVAKLPKCLIGLESCGGSK